MKKRILSILVGCFLLLVILELGIAGSAYLFSFYQNNLNRKISDQTRPYTIVAIGESTTAVSANENNTLLVQTTSYPYLLEEKLKKLIPERKVIVINKGIMAGDSTKIVREVSSFIKNNHVDAIVLMMGMKDESKAEAGKTEPFQLSALTRLLEYSRTYQLVQLSLSQKKLNDMNIDDTKEIKSFGDIPKDFRDDNIREVYYDIFYSGQLENITDQQLKDVMEFNLLGYYFYRTGQYAKAIRYFETSWKKYNMGQYLSYLVYTRLNDQRNAELNLKKLLLLNEKKPAVIKLLVNHYINIKRMDLAEKILAQAKKLKIENAAELQIAHAQVQQFKGMFTSAVEILKPVCGDHLPVDTSSRPPSGEFRNTIYWINQRAPKVECNYYMAELNLQLKNYLQTERYAHRFLKSNPKGFAALNILRTVYESQNKPEKAERIIKKFALMNKRLGEYFALADYYKSLGKKQEMQELYAMAAKDFPATVKNFGTIDALAKSKNAKLIIMQYPTFSLDFLRYLTRDVRGAFYVDNENIFNDDPKNKYFFEARYPYQFNHYTKEGSLRLAENLALFIKHAMDKGEL